MLIQVRVPGGQELPGGQAAAEPLPVLPLPEVPGRGHGQGGGAHRRAEGPARPPALQAALAAGVAALAARQPHHGARQGAHRDVAGHVPGQTGLLSGMCTLHPTCGTSFTW